MIKLSRIYIAARLLFVLVFLAALFAGIKSKPVPQVVPHFDLILHCGVFAVLAVLWVFSVSATKWLWGLFGLLVFGAGLELWQGWMMPARTASQVDMAANGAGVILGGSFAVILARFLPHR
uniref:hypothetical protein n=1 Tax=Microbulbifer agarilyticus TaxID=260552 RepID=UPI0002557F39|nr:hypothetical protein [Microbulbifer agarilyticus]